MHTREELIRRIVSRSGIMTSKGRRDLERELNAHLEDAIAEARSEGCDEATILQTVWARFGDPDEIAHDFAIVHRFERRAITIAQSLALVVYLLTGQHDAHFPLWASPLTRWTGITVACYFLTLLSRNDERRFLQRQVA